jgi:protease YdgD
MFKMELGMINRAGGNGWRPMMTATVILQIATFGDPECHDALAEPAPPAGHPTGVLGAQDHRVQIQPDQWPWSSIGHVNVVTGTSSLGWCTGTLIAPRRVLTAAHCLFNTHTNDWVKPGVVHFVVGQVNEKVIGHSLVESFITSPQINFKMDDRPRHDFMVPNMIRHDWAILRLQESVVVEPIPIRAVKNAELPATGGGGEIALAGYGSDHQYVLSVHKGCDAIIDAPEPGIITHMCDSAPGESGGPILLLRDGGAVVIGIHSANAQRFESQVGLKTVAGRGVSAAEFEAAVELQRP